MTEKSATRLAWALWSATMLLTATAIALVVVTRRTPAPVALLFRGSEAILAVPTATVGAVVASRRRYNPIGWLFCTAGLTVGLLIFTEHYADFALLTRHGSLPGGAAAAWVQSWLGPPGFFTSIAFLLLLFPSGHLPSRRWLPVAWVTGGAATIFIVAQGLRPGPVDVLRFVDNPLGVGARPGRALSASADIGQFLLLGSIILCTSAMLVRFRRSRGSERQQFKWLISAAALLGSVIAVTLATGGPQDTASPLDYLVLPAFAAVPVASGIAIVRHQLFDIDRIISRTVSYVVVTGLLVAAYAGLVVVFQAASRPLTGGSDLAVAASTLLVAAAFVPVRRRVQSFVDRRFNRSRYDASRTIEAFTARLRNEIDLGTLRRELVHVAQTTMQPTSTSLWIRDYNT